MATYVTSDIHGQYELFTELLEKINLKNSDTLYVLGDILDRGPHPIKALKKIMEMPNAVCIAGNHEVMALDCLESFYLKEITDDNLDLIDGKTLDNVFTWQLNGSSSTIDEFRKLSPEEKQKTIDFMKDFSVYEEVTVKDRDYILVHAGLGDFSPDKSMEDYSLDDLIWTRPDYDRQYFEDKFVITGHTPTQFIEKNPRPGFIYKNNNHIAIDCGAHIPGGRLAAYCMETGEEYYSSTNDL